MAADMATPFEKKLLTWKQDATAVINPQVEPTSASRLQVPQVAAKEERRVLLYASDGLSGEMGCLGRRSIGRSGVR
ncbi:hypothetical protein I0600191H4_01540 [Collinsella sp. i06-0019-1H4]